MNGVSKYTLIALGIVLPLLASAQTQQDGQTPMNQDVKVVREFAPTVGDANKIELMPALDDTSKYNPVFNYSILSRAFETNKGIEPISPARMAADKGGELFHSLAKAGLGTYSSVMAELDYNLLRSNEYVLGLQLNHFTSLGHLEFEDGATVDAPTHDTHVGVNFKRIFKSTILSTKLDYKHNLFDYYGYQTIVPDDNYMVDGTAVPGSDLMEDIHQRFGMFDMVLALESNQSGKSSTKWLGEVGFSSFGNKTGVHQNKIDVNGDLSIPLSAFQLKVGLGVSSFRVTAPAQNTPLYTFNDNQRTIISLLPRISMPFADGDVELGLLVVSEMGTNGDQLKLAPQLTGRLLVADGVVTIFGGLKGDYDANDYASVAYENPFVSPDINVNSSFYGIDLHAGIKANFSATTSFIAKVDYAFFNDEHFYANRTFMQEPVLGEPDTSHYVNRFGVVYDDGSLLKVGGELNIQPNEDLKIRLYATYYGWNLENETKAWHKPEMEMGLFGQYNVSPDFTLTANLGVVGKRYASVPELAEPKELKNYVDVNIGALYKLARQWSLWGRINNATASDYYRWNGYPSYKFNAMVGVVYSF